MAEIIKIIIEGESGYCPAGDYHSDRLTINRDSIRYEFDGLSLRTRIPGNWSYKTNSPIFQKLFTEAAAAVEEILNREDGPFVYDCGPIVFTVTYADKTEATRVFNLTGDYFKECFAIIKKMVPGCEDTPWVLWTPEDEDDEDYDDEDYDDEDYDDEDDDDEDDDEE